MVKRVNTKLDYVCNSCGASYIKWSGQCSACLEWNTLEAHDTSIRPSGVDPLTTYDIFSPVDVSEEMRDLTHIAELDRVLGGGLVAGSAVLLGGDPGIGKSTLLLQAAYSLKIRKRKVLYISGEESINQLIMRAKRLGVDDGSVMFAVSHNVDEIISTIDSDPSIKVVIIDSIQTVKSPEVGALPGSATQIRASAGILVSHIKDKNVSLIMVGHITKDGNIAGPKLLEHMVDVVLYFEGKNDMRILRSVKNRYGDTCEIGVFKMQEDGLHNIENPSSLFLPISENPVSGSCIFAAMEGTRAMLLEVQALTVPSISMQPKRSAVGYDTNRLCMLIAILSARLGIDLSKHEVYLNIAGGFKITDTGLDLPIIIAILSALYDVPVADTVMFGELSLSGDVRMVPNSEMRIKEANKLGFKKVIHPASLHDDKISTSIAQITRYLFSPADGKQKQMIA